MPNLVKEQTECYILKSGWVKKKTTKFILGYQDRYLILYSNRKLIYYKLKFPLTASIYKRMHPSVNAYTKEQLLKDFKKKGEFDLNLMGVQVSLEKPSNFRLQFQGIQRIFDFLAVSIAESADWKN